MQFYSSLASFFAQASPYVARFLAGWQFVSDSLHQIHPILLILAVIGLTLLVQGLVIFFATRHRRKVNNRTISSYVQQFVEERSKSEAILADLDIGVIAYSFDGQMINANPAARTMFQPQGIPDRLDEFFERYGQNNGLQAARLLGRDDIVVQVVLADKILRVRLKESRFEEGRKAGNLVIVQEITDQERLEKQRKEFVANVSHELKTPLTTIKTYSESLLDWGLDEKNDDGIRKDVRRIHDDAIRMEHLVADLLLLSSIDSKGIRVRMEQQDLAAMVRQTVDRLMHQALDKNIVLESFAVTTIPPIYADRSSVERILVNLISNAIKYTDKGGSIKVYIGHLIDDVYVKVVDTGFGIEKEHLPHIFNRFYRVDMTGSRMFGGTGLGLSIARELAELHGGKITVDSTLGKGTEFSVILPSAEKIYRDTLTAIHDGLTSQSLINQFAQRDLEDCARDCFDPDKDLESLDAEQCEQLLNRLNDTVGVPT
ncbi:MAG: cell wall metabolism sensor histidine kinase WalK [Clostridiales bacterium]|jgi:two-component system sensor histidine kinase VicK|nr:cell wall metabolism sensor histidine kinase WalK [Clostridiales bacterium]